MTNLRFQVQCERACSFQRSLWNIWHSRAENQKLEKTHSHHTGLVELNLQSHSHAGNSDKYPRSFKGTLAFQNKANCFAAPKQMGQHWSKNAERQVQPAMPWPRHARAEKCALWPTKHRHFCWGHGVQASETSGNAITKSNKKHSCNISLNGLQLQATLRETRYHHIMLSVDVTLWPCWTTLIAGCLHFKFHHFCNLVKNLYLSLLGGHLQSVRLIMSQI